MSKLSEENFRDDGSSEVHCTDCGKGLEAMGVILALPGIACFICWPCDLLWWARAGEVFEHRKPSHEHSR